MKVVYFVCLVLWTLDVRLDVLAAQTFPETRAYKDKKLQEALGGLIKYFTKMGELKRERLQQQTEEDNLSRVDREPLMGTGHGDDIDHPNLNDDSILKLLTSMLDEHNGKIAKTNFSSYHAGNDVTDTHLFTHLQKVQLGMESEYPGEEDNKMKRNTMTNTGQYWRQNIVPYEIRTSDFNQGQIDVINAAIAEMAQKTCIRWLPRSSSLASQVGHNDYVHIISDSGCYSYVGQVIRDGQPLSLQTPGCVTNAITIHEMCHAMGQMHEQSRTDRDEYISIIWNNVRGGTGNNNMAKYSTDDKNPYDVESVLQYRLRAFTTNGQPTQVLKDPRLDFLANARNGLGFYDIKDITASFGCTSGCTNPPSCQHKGYVDHTCACLCPRGVGGSSCENLLTDNGCGGDITLNSDGTPVTILSPNYPSNYNAGATCIWYITAPSDKHITLTIEDIHLSDNNGACYHWLEVQYNLIGQTGIRHCGDTGALRYVSSKDSKNNMMLIFDSAYSSDRAASQGFNLTVQATGTGCLDDPCLYGQCTNTGNGYTCECLSGFTGVHCDTISGDIDYTCTFEENKCIFKNSINDELEWTINSGQTPSFETGPSGAYEGLYYLYMETSSPAVELNRGILEVSPSLPGTGYCLSFWYHMYGANVYSLLVYYESPVNGITRPWIATGNQLDQWKFISVLIPREDNLKIYIQARRGASWNGDIAIDNVNLRSRGCANPCDNTPCLNSGSCSWVFDQEYTCSCSAPYTGVNCGEIADPCEQNPCLYGGTCTSDSNGEYTCNCVSPHTGENCGEIEPCISNPCMNDGSCTNVNATHFTCNCGEEYYGDTCNITYMPCDASPCMNNGNCTNINSTHFTCKCADAHYGQTCNVTYMPCDSSPCMNSGDCTNNNSTHFTCECTEDFHGTTCNITAMPCDAGPCMNDGTCTNVNLTDYTCDCPVGFSGEACGSSYLALACTFDEGSTCPFDNDEENDFDWTLVPDYSPSGSFSSGSSRQMYTEMSHPRKPGDVARLIVQTNITAMERCFKLRYFMYGKSMGSLRVKLGTSILRTESGSHGNRWHNMHLNVPSIANPLIKIEAERGNDWDSDIYIDDVMLLNRPCGCLSAPCMNGGTCQEEDDDYTCDCAEGFLGTHCEIIVEGNLTCSFETGENCFFTFSTVDSLDWLIGIGDTPTPGTGPSGASHGSLYAFIEASGSSKTNEMAEMYTTATFNDSIRCLTFDYHMYGADTGTLRVLFNDTSVWSRSGNQGNSWIRSGVEFSTLLDSQIKIQAVRGPGVTGDIAIDNLALAPHSCGCLSNPCKNNGTCSDSVQSTDILSTYTCQCPNGFTGQNCDVIPVSRTFFCTFEKNEDCIFKQNIDGGDDFDWTIISGPTPTKGTGPSSAYMGLQYAFMETSRPRSYKEIAILETEDLVFEEGERCLKFRYYMYGSNVDELKVMYLSGTRYKTALRVVGDQGQQWNEAEMKIKASTKFSVIIRGRVGAGPKSDIAIDNIYLGPYPCPA